MSENFILIASVLCFIVGLGFCWPPIGRYIGRTTVSGFGYFLVFMGVILMTTFKWTEVVVEAQGYKLQIAQAQQQITELNKRISARDVAIASYREGIDVVTTQIHEVAQGDAYAALLEKWSQAGIHVAASGSGGQLGLAALNAGYRLVPVSAVKELDKIKTSNPKH